MFDRAWALFKTAIFTIVVPGTVAVYLPDALTRGAVFAPPSGLAGYAALIPIAFGVVLYARCAWDFSVVGLGTPAPIDPPKALVRRGPYRWTRNPIYVAVTSVLVGEWILTGSSALGWHALAVFVGFNAFVMLYEEPTLREKFGDEYTNYCGRVPRWL